MTENSPALENTASSLLTEDENLRLNWKGVLKEGESERPTTFIATDDRLIFSHGKGHFKDIGLQHIESVEAGRDTETEFSGTDPDNYFVQGVVAVFLGFGAVIIGEFSPLATLASLFLFAFGGYSIWYGKANYDELAAEHQVSEQVIYHVQLNTSATSGFSAPIHIKTGENVGPEISKLVQEAK